MRRASLSGLCPTVTATPASGFRSFRFGQASLCLWLTNRARVTRRLSPPFRRSGGPLNVHGVIRAQGHCAERYLKPNCASGVVLSTLFGAVDQAAGQTNMEFPMRGIPIVVALLVVGSSTGLAVGEAAGVPVHKVVIPQATIGLVDNVASRRYLRRHGNTPLVSTPNVVVAPFTRPRSCGEFNYWDGIRCVDARYVTPDVGPKG